MYNTVEEKILEIIRKLKERYGAENISHMMDIQFVSCDVENKKCVFEFELKEWERNPYGNVHGGIIAGMLDEAIGVTCAAMQDNEAVTTADLQISFLRPWSDDRFTVETEITKDGSNLMRALARAYGKDKNKPLATATSTYSKIHVELD